MNFFNIYINTHILQIYLIIRNKMSRNLLRIEMVFLFYAKFIFIYLLFWHNSTIKFPMKLERKAIWGGMDVHISTETAYMCI